MQASYRSPRMQAHPVVGPGPPNGGYYQPQQQPPPQYYHASPPPQTYYHASPAPLRYLEDPQREEKQALTISSLQTQILAMTKELSATSSELSHVSAENVLLNKDNTELSDKLEATRDALRETRSSLEQVQAVLKPLAAAHKSRDQQTQHLASANAALEVRLAECEARARQAEATIRQQAQDAAGQQDDSVLIDKLHERLVASQDTLVRTQNDLQRLQVQHAAAASELGDSRHKMGTLEVQLLLQQQSFQQTLQAKKDEFAAKENTLFVELAACRRRLAALEEAASTAASARDAMRIAEEREKGAALGAEIRAAMTRLGPGSGGQSRSTAAVAAADAPPSRIGHGSSSPTHANTHAPTAPTGPTVTAVNASPPSSSSPSSPGFLASLASGKFLQAGRKPPVPQVPPPGKARSPSPYSLAYNPSPPSPSSPSSPALSAQTDAETPGRPSYSSSPPQGAGGVGAAMAGAPLGGRGTGGAGGSGLGLGLGLGLLESTPSPSRQADDDAASSDINVPIFFRPLGDLQDDVRRLERERDGAVAAINAWTEGFVRAQRREPGPADVAASPQIKGLYNQIAEVRLNGSLSLNPSQTTALQINHPPIPPPTHPLTHADTPTHTHTHTPPPRSPWSCVGASARCTRRWASCPSSVMPRAARWRTCRA